MNNDSTLADLRDLSKLVAETVATLAPARLTATNTETDEETVSDFQNGPETVEQLYAGVKSGRLEKSNTPTEVFIYSDGFADIYRPPGQPATKSQQVARSLLQLAPYMSEVNVRTHGESGFDTIRRNGQPATATADIEGIPTFTFKKQTASRHITGRLKQIGAPPTARHVLRVMISDYQGKDLDIYPSAQTIADDLGMSSEKAIRNAWAWLESHHVIWRFRDANQHSPTWWRVHPIETWKP